MDKKTLRQQFNDERDEALELFYQAHDTAFSQYENIKDEAYRHFENIREIARNQRNKKIEEIHAKYTPLLLLDEKLEDK